MMTTDERLSALERELRVYRRAAIGCVVILAVSLLGAALQDKEKKVIECDLLKAGSITSETGLTIGGDDTDRCFLGPRGIHAIPRGQRLSAFYLFINDFKGGTLQLSNSKGKRVVEMGTRKSGDGGIVVRNKLNNLIVMLRADDYGHGEVWAMNRDGSTKGRSLTSGK